MAVDDLNLLSDDDVAKYREKGEHRRHRRFAVYDEEGDMVDLETICEIPNSGASLVCMCNDYNFMTTIDEFLERDKYWSEVEAFVSSRSTIGICDFQPHL